MKFTEVHCRGDELWGSQHIIIGNLYAKGNQSVTLKSSTLTRRLTDYVTWDQQAEATLKVMHLECDNASLSPSWDPMLIVRTDSGPNTCSTQIRVDGNWSLPRRNGRSRLSCAAAAPNVAWQRLLRAKRDSARTCFSSCRDSFTCLYCSIKDVKESKRNNILKAIAR